MILYSIRAIASGYLIAKFNDDFDVDSTYEVSPSACSCPAFHRRQSCKHQDILAKFILREKVDSEWFYCREADSWHNPLGLESMPRVEPAFPEAQPVPVDLHDSDCSTHNEPAYPNGPCDCSLSKSSPPTSPPLSVPRQVSSTFRRRI
jgi:hypothetical protein